MSTFLQAVYDSSASSVAERIAGLRALHQAGIPLVLRIDPLFPRLPIGDEPCKNFSDFGLPEPQTLEDIESLVDLAKEIQAMHVVYSVAKITQPRGRKLSPIMTAMRSVYEQVSAGGPLIFRGGSWRLANDVARKNIAQPFLAICKSRGIVAKHCKQNLLETR